MKFKDYWNIIPIVRGMKKPLIKWDRYKTEKFPREKLEKYQDCNYGVICGEISDGLFTIDLDFKDNIEPIEGFKEIWKKFSTKFPKLQNTYTVRSPHGFHIYFRVDFYLETNHYRENSIVFSDILKGTDIQSNKAYVLIPPSIVDGLEYIEFMPFDVINLNKKDWNRIKNFFIREIMPDINYSQMRQPFIDILEGKIEIEAQSRKIFGGDGEKQEFIYWKYLYIEAFNRCNLRPNQLYPFLKKNQPAFDLKKTEEQLKHHPHTSRPLTYKKTQEYFPSYEFEFETNGDSKKAVYIKIADHLIEKYNLITMDDTEVIFIRDGNTYSTNLNEFYNDLADLIEYYGKSINHVSSSVLKRIKYKTRFSREDFCYDEWIISFKDGYYDIKTDKFYPNGEYSDKLFCYEIPHNFPHDKHDCPHFKKILQEWLGNNNKVSIDDMFEMMGYTMTMNTDMKTAFFIFGPSNAGKTQFQKILEHIIGHKNRINIPLGRLCKNEFGTEGAEFKLIDMVGDMGESLPTSDVSTFKEFTGDDEYMRAEMKGGKKYQFRNICRIWYNGNDIPALKKDDRAFYNRWVITNFPNVFEMWFESTIKRIGKKICENLEEVKGILCEAIEGVKRLYKRQYFRRELLQNTRHTWKYNAEPIYAFICEHCAYDKNGKIECKEFREQLDDYLISRQMETKSSNELTSQLKNYGIFKKRNTYGEIREYYYRGIRFKKNLEKYTEVKFEEIIKNE